MAVKFNMHVDDAAVKKMLAAAELKLSAPEREKALAEVAVLILDNDKKQWGKNWKPDADSTMAQKNKAGAREVGVRTGALKASLTEPGASHQIHEITPDGMKLGSDLYYAKFFQKGTKRGGRGKRKSAFATGQPPRKALRLTAAVKREIADYLGRRLLPGGKR